MCTPAYKQIKQWLVNNSKSCVDNSVQHNVSTQNYMGITKNIIQHQIILVTESFLLMISMVLLSFLKALLFVNPLCENKYSFMSN